jgi:hypothetical protein
MDGFKTYPLFLVPRQVRQLQKERCSKSLPAYHAISNGQTWYVILYDKSVVCKVERNRAELVLSSKEFDYTYPVS